MLCKLDDYLPKCVRRCCPSAIRQIQDKTQLGIIILLLLSVSLSIRDALVVAWLPQLDSIFSAQEVAGLVFEFACTVLIVQAMTYWDDREQLRLTSLEAVRLEFREAYMRQIAAMENVLTEVAESNVNLAEVRFAESRASILALLDNLLSRFGRGSSTSPQFEADLLRELIPLVRRWAKLFGEVSIDPVGRPVKLELRANELELFNGLSALVFELKDRIQKIEVKVLTGRRFSDANVLKRLQNTIGTADATPTRAPEVAHMRTADGDIMLRRSSRRPLRELPLSALPRRCCTWVRISRECSLTCGCHVAPHEQLEAGVRGYPRMAGCGCCEMSVLSRRHAYLLFCLLATVSLSILRLATEIWMSEDGGNTGWLLFLCTSPLIILSLCLLAVLARIDQIHTLAQLDLEVVQLKQECKAVRRYKGDMTKFWEGAKQLAQMWWRRTIPCLDLLREVSSLLVLEDDAAIVQQLQAVNKQFGLLEREGGALRDWCNTNSRVVGPRERQRFEERIRAVVSISPTTTMTPCDLIKSDCGNGCSAPNSGHGRLSTLLSHLENELSRGILVEASSVRAKKSVRFSIDETPGVSYVPTASSVGSSMFGVVEEQSEMWVDETITEMQATVAMDMEYDRPRQSRKKWWKFW